MTKEMPAAPVAVFAAEVAPNKSPSNYPPVLAARVADRTKRKLGETFGLSNFGVNLTTLAPGAATALRHAHALQDEFVYVLAGAPTLITDAGETLLGPGMCAGFKAGTGDGHCLVNRTSTEVVLLEVGDRAAGDSVSYPDDDVQAVLDGGGRWRFSHKNGEPY